MIILIFSLLLSSFGFGQANSTSEPQKNTSLLKSRLPTFASILPNINDFNQFADSGPDGNWYIGFNNAWIVKLPPVPVGDFTRAFIGAKIGRAKSQSRSGHPWEREPIPGKIYMAVSQNPAFSSQQSFFLVDTTDVPLESDARIYTPGAGQSQWFWAEVPIALISTKEPNYLIIWSPTEEFTSAASAPILAAGESRGKSASEDIAQAWLNRKIQGVPPRRDTGTLETPINHLSPALAIKLVPVNDAEVGVNECSVSQTGQNYIFHFSVDAENAELAWLEESPDQIDWQRVSSYLRQPPYEVTLTPEKLGARGVYFRAAAQDDLGNVGTCDPVFVGRSKR